MEYKTVDKELIEILKIKNLSSIKITNIANPKNTDLHHSLLGVFVLADGKMYHYIQSDRYFDEFLAHIITQYRVEKTHHSIAISKELVPLFEGEDSLDDDLEEAHFQSMKGFSKSKIKYERKKIGFIYPLLVYELSKIAHIVHFEESYQSIQGYRFSYILQGIRNHQKVQFPVRIHILDDFHYEIEIDHYFKLGEGIKITMSFLDDKISVHWINQNQKVSGVHDISFHDDGAYEKAYLYLNGQCISYDSERIPASFLSKQDELQNSLEMFGVNGNFQVIPLPWGDFHFVEVTTENLDDGQQEINRRHLNLSSFEENVFLTYSKVSTIQSLSSRYKIKLGGRRSFHHAILPELDDDYGIIETKFYPVLFAKSGYKLHLENLCFYEYFLGTEKQSSMPIPHLEETDLGYQLLEEQEFQKILKRGEL